MLNSPTPRASALSAHSGLISVSMRTPAAGPSGGERSAKPEAHRNTMEGIWTGVRIFLAPSRGVSKWYQAQYAAVFEWVHNAKRITGEFVRALLGLRVVTNPRT
jgi:hypothetical protein